MAIERCAWTGVRFRDPTKSSGMAVWAESGNQTGFEWRTSGAVALRQCPGSCLFEPSPIELKAELSPARAHGDEKSIQPLDLLGHRVFHADESLVERVLRGTEFLQDPAGAQAPPPGPLAYMGINPVMRWQEMRAGREGRA